MAIKELAYSAQQHLQSSTGCLFKRSHIYELLASSFGFRSYAALCTDHVFTQRDKSTMNSVQFQPMLRQRIAELGYDPIIVDAAAPSFLSFVGLQHIDVLRITDLVDELSSDDGFSEELWSYRDSGEYPPVLLECLEAKATKGDHRAHYALALIYKPYDDEYPHETGSEYWYSQEQKGRVLKGVEKEWADGYARQLEEAEKNVFHLREAGRLGNSSALLDLAEMFKDPSYFDAAITLGITDDSIRVAELAETLGRDEDAKHWLTVAAETGDTDAMRQLIDDSEDGNLQQSWMWVYLAKMLGTDLTKDEYYAIHEDGSHYDDDVGGPMYVDGIDGVKLKPLDEKGTHEARRLAEEIFLRIQQPI